MNWNDVSNPHRLLNDYSPLPLIIYGPDLRVRYLNGAARRAIPACLAGANPEGLHFADFGLPGDLTRRATALFETVLLTREAVNSEMEFAGPNGTVHVEFQLFPALGASGAIEFILGIGNEISGIRRVERELRSQREKYERAVREGRVYPWDYDPVSGRTNLDAAYLDRIGLTPETVPPDPEAWYEWMHPEDRGPARAAVEPWTRGEIEHYRYEFRSADARGETTWFECRGGFEYREGQSVPLQVGVNIDITERKRVERELAESEQRFAQFMDHSPAMAWIKDSQRRIIYGNRRTLEFIGRPAAEVLGKTTAEVLGDEFDRRSLEHDNAVLVSGRTITANESIPRGGGGGGTSPWLIVRFPLERGGERQLGAVALDSSELYRLQEEQNKVERQLLHAQKVGIARRFGRWHRPRLQQFADRDARVRFARADGIGP